MDRDGDMKRKVKLLSDHDVKEVVAFQRYLDDMRTMNPHEFYQKYQEYMGLSNAEVKTALTKHAVHDTTRQRRGVMAEIEKFEGDLFWNDDNPEDACWDPHDELDNVGEGEIVEFQQAKKLPNFFGVLVDGKERYFDTLEEAEAACIKPQPEESEQERVKAGD